MSVEVHDQKNTYLCVAFSTVSALRYALRSFISKVKGNNEYNEPKFSALLCQLTGCVHPRSMDGLVDNSLFSSKYMGPIQSGIARKVFDRLKLKTAFEVEGWKRMPSVTDAITAHGLSVENIKLECQKTSHPKSGLLPGFPITKESFKSIIDKGYIAVVQLMYNFTDGKEGVTSTAVLLYDYDGEDYLVKHSTADNPIIKIPRDRMTYFEWEYKLQLRPNFKPPSFYELDFDDANDYILFDFGYYMEFITTDTDMFNTDLSRFLKSQKIRMTHRYIMFEKILDKLVNLQTNGIDNLELKLANILITTDENGNWNEKYLVISDFGIGESTVEQYTSGFASPEQFVGRPHEKSYNYSLGRIMVFLFCTWETAWNWLFLPVTDKEYRSNRVRGINTEHKIISIIKSLTKVDPDERAELEIVKSQMLKIKKEIRQLQPISFNFGHRITRSSSTKPKFNDQKITNLCASYSTITLLRTASNQYLEQNGIPLDDAKVFSFDLCLKLYIGCVSPGIIWDYVSNNDHLKDHISRISQDDLFGTEGWKRILPVIEIFKKYDVDTDLLELSYRSVYHPRTSNGSRSFNFLDALKNNQLVAVSVYHNWRLNTKISDHSSHAVILFDHDDKTYHFKNSSPNPTPYGAQLLKIPKDIITYGEFTKDQRLARNFTKENNHLTNEHLLINDVGYVLQFKDKK